MKNERAQFRTPPPSYSNFWAILSQKLFLQKMIRNDVLSDRKVLQKFRDTGQLLFHKSFGLISGVEE